MLPSAVDSNPPTTPMKSLTPAFPLGDTTFRLAPLHRDDTCRYASKKCREPRALKRNGALHKLCEGHRQTANLNQRRLESKRKARAAARLQVAKHNHRNAVLAALGRPTTGLDEADDIDILGAAEVYSGALHATPVALTTRSSVAHSSFAERPDCDSSSASVSIPSEASYVPRTTQRDGNDAQCSSGVNLQLLQSVVESMDARWYAKGGASSHLWSPADIGSGVEAQATYWLDQSTSSRARLSWE